MSAILGLYRSTLGKKYLMAVTGLILFAYVVVHMLGNLQIYIGAERINAYAKLLHTSESLLWVARSVLLFCVGVHILASVQLWLANRAARPVRYAKRAFREADYAARTMVWSGPIIATFVVYHVLHLTTGGAHHDFVHLDVFHNVTTSFSQWPVAGVYIAANLLLAVHLYHGLWSLFQSLGASHPSYDRLRNVFALAFAGLIGLGNVSIPVAVLAGLVK